MRPLSRIPAIDRLCQMAGAGCCCICLRPFVQRRPQGLRQIACWSADCRAELESIRGKERRRALRALGCRKGEQLELPEGAKKKGAPQ